MGLGDNFSKIHMFLDTHLAWRALPDTQGVGLRNNISSIPAAVTDVRMTPRVTQECLVIRSSSLNRKKEERFPMTPETFRIAQNIPEFLVIVSLSELCVRNVP